MGLLSTRLVLNGQKLTDTNTVVEKDTQFLITSGETALDVAKRLVQAGLLNETNLLIDYWTYKGMDRLVQTGAYVINKGSSPIIIANKLVNQSPDLITVSFIPGWRKEEVVDMLQFTNLVDGDFLINSWENTIFSTCLPEGFAGVRNAEGFLFADEYVLPRALNAENMLCEFVSGFGKNLPDDFIQRSEDSGLNGYEAVILASIIEKEAILPEEAARISGVFHNRLALDMRLQSDPTVQYALGWQEEMGTWWNNPLTAADLQIDSPYNTYLIEGLPPTPICSPGIGSLNAAISPENHDLLYFRAACDGSGEHIFSRTYEEHLAAACD